MKLSIIKKTNLKKKHVEPPEESIIARFSEVGPGSDADMEKTSSKSLYQLKYSQLGPNCERNPQKRQPRV